MTTNPVPATQSRNLDRPSTNYASSLSEAIHNGLAFPKTDQRQAGKHADRLLACYPNGKPADPRGYIAAVVTVLSEYPEEIVARVTDPRTGVVRTCRFLPSIAELSDALEQAMEPLRRRWREERERKAQAERDAEPPAIPDAGARERVRQKMQQLSEELSAAPDPVPPKAGTSAGEAVARVLADIAAREIERTTKPSGD